MKTDDRIRSAFDDLSRRARTDLDLGNAHRRVAGRPRLSRMAPALAGAVLVLAVIGGFALLDLLPGLTEPDDVVAPPTTETSITTTTSIPGEPVSPVRFDPRVAGQPFVVISDVDGFRAGLLGGSLGSLPDQVFQAAPDGMGGWVYVDAGAVVHLREDGSTATLVESGAHLAGVRGVDGSPVAVVLVGDELRGLGLDGPDPGPISVVTLAGDVVDVSVADGLLAAIVVDTEGCRQSLVVELATNATREVGTAACIAQEEGFPRAVAVSDGLVALAESVPLGEIEFTADRISAYDASTGALVHRVEIDTFADLDVMDLDLVGVRALVAGEYLWSIDLASGTVQVLHDPTQGGGAVVAAHWSQAEGRSSDDASVPAFRVSGVSDDDVLNVRTSPDPSAPLLAALPHDYAGLGDTGEMATAPDGGTWRRVALLDPVRLVGLDEPLRGSTPTGWVNAAYLDELDAGVAVEWWELTPCSGSSVTGGGATQHPSDHVYAVRTGNVGECVRTVITLGEGFDPIAARQMDAISTDIRSSSGLPTFEVRASSGAIVINFPTLRDSWPTEANRQADAYVAREPDGSLSVVVLGDPSRAVVRAVSGHIVVDLPPEAVSEPPTGKLVVIEELTITGDRVFVRGLARPFEANLGIELRDAQGDPVTATFSGTEFLGTVTDSRYAAMTTDWIDAWGWFSFEVSELAPGDYQLMLDAFGGADQPDGLLLPFTVSPPG